MRTSTLGSHQLLSFWLLACRSVSMTVSSSGTGSFWVVALICALGFNLIKATAYTKVMNFTSNVVSLLVFICGGAVLWREGLVMGAGQFIGARIGSRLVVLRGARFIRPIFITMVLAISARLIWQNLK